jgi:hypothetical protein
MSAVLLLDYQSLREAVRGRPQQSGFRRADHAAERPG